MTKTDRRVDVSTNTKANPEAVLLKDVVAFILTALNALAEFYEH